MTLFLIPLLAAAAQAAAPTEQARKSMDSLHDFGACMVRAAPGEVNAMLVMDQQSPEYGAKLVAAMNGPAKRCQKKAKGFSVGSALFAGIMAESALRARFQPSVPTDMLGPDPRRQAIRARNDLETVGLCTVLSAPAASSRLIATAPTSVAEVKAIEALRPNVTGCLRKDAKMSVTPPVLRSVIALAAWRIVYAPRKDR